MSLARAITRGHINRLYAEDLAAHDWYRFVLSFPPHIVRDYVARFGLDEKSCVLDPFCGTGTTVVECKKLGIESVGIEANPMAHFASRVKVDWSPEPQKLKEHAEFVAGKTLDKLRAEGIDDDSPPPLFLKKRSPFLLRELGAEQMKLLLTNSISPLPLHKALTLLETIREQADESHIRHELLALAKILVYSISNLHFGPEVGVGKAKEDAPVVSVWLAGVEAIANDLYELQALEGFSSLVHQADARDTRQFLGADTIDAVITSPPYPNEKDYTRTTRLESVLLGFINSKESLRSFKKSLMRSNTRTVYKGDSDDSYISDHAEVQRIARDIEARRLELGKTSGFERLYAKVTKLYFGGMAKHLADLRGVLRPGAQLAYVVGDQASYFRVMIRTGQILADIADSLGYQVVDVELFRSRLSTATKEQLREEIVILKWPGARKSSPFTLASIPSGERHLMSKGEDVNKQPVNRYVRIIERVFTRHYKPGLKEVTFTRDEFEVIAKELNVNLPKNSGDIIYSFRYRVALPDVIRETASQGEHWIIRSAGRGVYKFALVPEYDVTPNPAYSATKIPDSTPGLISKYALSDEQALLAKLRYNRLIDIFTGITCYSLQNHLRTSIAGLGQVETDEVYIGVDKRGVHHVFPVQAKGGKDRLGIVQIEQDFALCASKFPELSCHPIAAQFMADDVIALFEFENDDDGIKVSAEKHYQLVAPNEITPELLELYKHPLPGE